MNLRTTIPLRTVHSMDNRNDAFTLKALPPLALYIHFPWCIRKCPYCDFNSHTLNDTFDEAQYLDTLRADLDSALPEIWGRRIGSIFIGGGTPSLLSVDAVEQLLSMLRQRLTLLPTSEITLEANPGAVEAEKFKAFAKEGINRISLGIQSFSDDSLRALGRIHDADCARRAASIAIDYFENVNFDLIYALPQQTLTQALTDIRTALAFAPNHLSAYQLTIEPNTAFAATPPDHMPDNDAAAEMGEKIENLLEASGYNHYETSAFAKTNQQCRHNLNYWQFGDYLGIGPGAHSKISFPDRIMRKMRWKHPLSWLRASHHIQNNPNAFIQEEHSIEKKDLPGEFVMNAFRLNEGFAPELFHARTGLPLAQIIGKLQKAAEDELIEIADARIKPTLRGRRFLNELICRFL